MEAFRFGDMDTTNYFYLPPPGNPIPNIFNFNQAPPPFAPLAPPPRSQQQKRQTSHPRQIHRNRISYSCHACRRRKVKCDRQHPMCSNCTKTVESCVYDDHAITHKGKDEKTMRGVKRRRTNEDVSTIGEEGYSRGYIVPRDETTAAATSPPRPLDVNKLGTKVDKLVEIVGRLYKDASAHGATGSRPGRSNTLATKGLAKGGLTQSQPYLDALQKAVRPVRYDSTSTETNLSTSASPSPTRTLSSNIPTTPGSSTGSRSQDISDGCVMKTLIDKVGKFKGQDNDEMDDLGIGHLSIQDDGRSRYVGTGFWGLLSDEKSELNKVLKAHVDPIGSRKKNSKQAYAPPGTSGSSSNPLPAAPHPLPEPETYPSEYPQVAVSVFTKAEFLQFEPREFQGGTCEVVPTIIKGLPSKMYSDYLYKSFLRGVHPVMPLLHAPTFDNEYKSFWQLYPNDQRTPSDSTPAGNPTFIALLTAVLYAGTISIQGEKIKELTAGAWTKESLLSLLYGSTMSALAAFSFPRCSSLYCLISFLITQTCLVREEEPLTSCSFVGMAMRVAQSMGLHRDGSLFNLPEVDCEVRRRVWWHIMYLDVQGAIATGLPPFGGSCGDLYDTQMVSEFKDEYIGLSPGAADPVTSVTHDALPQEFHKDEIDIRSSPSMILAVGRYESTILLRSLITRMLKIRLGKRSELYDMGKMIFEVKLKLDKKISRIPVPEMGFTPPRDPGEEGGIGVESSEAERDVAFNCWARVMLSLFTDRAFGVLYQPFLRSAKSNAWRHGRSCAIHYCHAFLRKFLHLSRAQLFQPYQWFCPGTYQPLHSVMILLLDLHERPSSKEALTSRNFINGVFSIFGECGNYGEGNRPLLEGGREAWSMLWRLREKAYEKAGIQIPSEQKGGEGRRELEKIVPEEEQFLPAPLAPPPFSDIFMQPPTPTPVGFRGLVGDSIEELLEMARIIDEADDAFLNSPAVKEWMEADELTLDGKLGFGKAEEKVEEGAAQVQEDNQFDPMAGGQEMMEFDWDEWDQVFGTYFSVDMGGT